MMGLEKMVTELLWFEVHGDWLECACYWADPATHPDLYAVMINGC